MKCVNNRVWDKALGQVSNQVRDRVMYHVLYEVTGQVKVQVGNLVEDPVDYQVVIEFDEDANNPGKMPIP